MQKSGVRPVSENRMGVSLMLFRFMRETAENQRSLAEKVRQSIRKNL